MTENKPIRLNDVCYFIIRPSKHNASEMRICMYRTSDNLWLSNDILHARFDESIYEAAQAKYEELQHTYFKQQ